MKQKELFQPLKNKIEISEIFEKGIKLYSANLLMRFVKKDGRENFFPIRVLMAFPKKQLGAVRRNRLKRICKSSLFECIKNSDIEIEKDHGHSFNVVFHARENFEKLTPYERNQEFGSLIKRLIKQ